MSCCNFEGRRSHALGYMAALRRVSAYRRSAQMQKNIRQREAPPGYRRRSTVPGSSSMTTPASPSADFLML